MTVQGETMSEVRIVLLDGFDLFEAIAAKQAFELANRALRTTRHSAMYSAGFFAQQAGPVRSDCEVALIAQALPDKLARRVDHMILVAGSDAAQVLRHPTATQREFITWLARESARIGRLAAIGEAAFVLVHAAIGDTRPPAPSDQAAAAASTSGIELALQMITHDVGHRTAMQVAQRFVPTPERIGAPFRFRSRLGANANGDERVLTLNRWIASHLRQHLTNDLLAQRLSMTPRTFLRFYQRATGFTPARAVEQIRVEHACHVLETTMMTLKDIAHRSGFSSQELMRRTFVRLLEMPPSQYRRQFYGRV